MAQRFAWTRLSENAPIQQVVRALNRGLPMLTPAIDAAADAAANAVPRYTHVVARITAYTATTVTFEAVATIPPAAGADPCLPAGASGLRVSVVALTNTTIADPAGYTLGTRRANSATWTVARPAAGQTATVTVESTLEDAFGTVDPLGIADTDVLVVPAQGEAVSLVSAVRVVARVTGQTATTVTVTVTVTGEGTEPPTAGTLTIDSWTGLASGEATPTPVSGPLPIVQAYTITKPAFGAGDGRAVWAAVSTDIADALTDKDAQTVPEVGRDTITLAIGAAEVFRDAGAVVFDVTASDPLGAVVPTITTPVHASVTVTGTVTGAGVRTTTLSILRPAVGADDLQFLATATATDRATATTPIVVPAVSRDTVTLAPKLVQAAVTATTESYYAEHGAVPAGVGAITYATSGTATVASGAGTSGDPWVVTRPVFGSGASRLTVTASATGASSGTDAADVTPQERDTVGLTLRVTKIDEPTATTIRYATLATDPTDGTAGLEATVESEAGVGAATTYDTGTGYFTVTRPAYNGGVGRVVFIAQRTDGGPARTPARQTIDVPPREDTTTAGKRAVIGPMALLPQNRNTPNIFDIATDGTYSHNGHTASIVMFAPIPLPPGVTVTGIDYVYRNPSGGTVQFYTYGNGAALDTAVLTADSAGADATYSVVLSHVVSAFVPTFFWVALEGGHGTAQRFVRAVVTYTAPSLTTSV